MGRIDRSRANIKRKGFLFEPFRPTAEHELTLADEDLPAEQDLLVFERGGQRRAVSLLDASYHHVIQGELAGEPYLVSF